MKLTSELNRPGNVTVIIDQQDARLRHLVTSRPGCCRLTRRRPLRDLYELADVVAHRFYLRHERGIPRRIDSRRACHDPNVVASAAGDDRLGIAGVNMRYDELCLDRPYELHAPDGVIGALDNKAPGLRALCRPVERPLIEGEGRLDGSVSSELIRLDGVIDVLLEEGRDNTNDIPGPHVPGQIKRGHDGYRDLRGRDGAAGEKAHEQACNYHSWQTRETIHFHDAISNSRMILPRYQCIAPGWYRDEFYPDFSG